MILKQPGDLQKAIDTLDSLAKALRDLFGQEERSPICRLLWLRWWEWADSSLRGVFTDDDLITPLFASTSIIRATEPASTPMREVPPAGVIFKPTTKDLFGLGDQKPRYEPGTDVTVMSLLKRERDLWVERFEAAAAGLRQVQVFADRPGLFGVLDTSAFLEGQQFHLANWPSVMDAHPPGKPPLAVHLVVPLLVVEELDAGKISKVDRVHRRSASALKELWGLPRVAAECSGVAEVLKLNERVTVEILLDPPGHVRQPVNDFEITDRAVYVQSLLTQPRRVSLVAGDYSMLFRARSLGLDTKLIERLESGDPGNRASSPR